MITLKKLVKVYDRLKALDIPALEISKGESLGLVGNNGAGKTTLFRLILDLIQPTTGEVLINGINVAHSEEWKHFTGSYLDEGFLIDFLRPDEYFELTARLYGLSAGDFDEFRKRFSDFFAGEIFGSKKYIRYLSKGNQKKVGIAAAMMPNPALLVLDEPFTNLDPTSQIRLKNLLRREQQAKNVTLLVSSHDLNHVTDVCNRIVVLEKGSVVHDLATGENTLEVLQAYFAT